MTPESAPKLKSKARPRELGISQIRTIARRAGMDVNHLLVKLRTAGVKSLDNGPLYASSKVNLDEAMRELQIAAENVGAEAPPPISPTERLSAAAAKVDPLAPPTRPYIGDETQSQPQFIVEGASASAFRDFPPIPNPDSDKVYWPCNVNPDRQSQKIMEGFQFVVDPEHIRRIGLGSLERFINSRGRVQYKDRELAFITVDQSIRRAKARRDAQVLDRKAVDESYHDNIAALRRSLGKGSDAKLSSFEMSEGEAIERQEAAETKRRGRTRVTIDMGSTKTE
jgi:hypothetical protein